MAARPRDLGRPFMSPLALALAFRVRGCFVFPCCWLALGVGRAARAAVSLVQIDGRHLALMLTEKMT